MNLIKFVESSIEEMKKVTWPTKKETYNYTILVIAISIALALFLGGLDYLFSGALKLILK